MVKWFRLHDSAVLGTGLNSCQGTKIPHAMQCDPKKSIHVPLKSYKSSYSVLSHFGKPHLKKLVFLLWVIGSSLEK